MDLCASKAEAKRYRVLLSKEKRGQIADLEFQPVIEIEGGKYIADFRYREGFFQGAKETVEDVKGKAGRTPLYNHKKRQVKERYGIDIAEIEA